MANNNNNEDLKKGEETKKVDTAKEPEAPVREVVNLEAPVPETVSNVLGEGKGYFVNGVLVSPNGEPLK